MLFLLISLNETKDYYWFLGLVPVYIRQFRCLVWAVLLPAYLHWGLWLGPRAQGCPRTRQQVQAASRLQDLLWQLVHVLSTPGGAVQQDSSYKDDQVFVAWKDNKAVHVASNIHCRETTKSCRWFCCTTGKRIQLPILSMVGDYNSDTGSMDILDKMVVVYSRVHQIKFISKI